MTDSPAPTGGPDPAPARAGLAPRVADALEAALAGAAPIAVARPDLGQAWRRTAPTVLFAIVFLVVLLPLTAAAVVTALAPSPATGSDPIFSGWFIAPLAAPLLAAALLMLAAPVLAVRSARATAYALTEREAIEVDASGRRPQTRRLALADVADVGVLARARGGGDLILRHGPPDRSGRRALMVLRGLPDPYGWEALVAQRRPAVEDAPPDPGPGDGPEGDRDAAAPAVGDPPSGGPAPG